MGIAAAHGAFKPRRSSPVSIQPELSSSQAYQHCQKLDGHQAQNSRSLGWGTIDMDVSENSGTHKSSILIGVSIINHPFWGTPIFGNTHMVITSTIYSDN